MKLITYFFFVCAVVPYAHHAYQSPIFFPDDGTLEPLPRARTPNQEAFDALNQGDCYFYGIFGFKKDLNKALSFYTKASAPSVRKEIRELAEKRLKDLLHEMNMVQLNFKSISDDKDQE